VHCSVLKKKKRKKKKKTQSERHLAWEESRGRKKYRYRASSEL